jgi:hypothetical protein
MKIMAAKSGKIDPRVLGLGALLGLALLGVGLSWRMSQTASSGAAAASAPTSVEQMSQEADRLSAEVQTRLREDSKAIETDWPVVEVPKVAVPKAAAKQAGMDFRLRGVVRGGTHPAAFLNDKTLLLGEELNGFKLVGIEDNHVTLQDPTGRKHEVFLESEK